MIKAKGSNYRRRGFASDLGSFGKLAKSSCKCPSNFIVGLSFGKVLKFLKCS